MRFRKRMKVFPGFYLNFSNSGISSTIGVKGASINFSRKGTYLNSGIPGIGFYNRQKIGGSTTAPKHNDFNNSPLEQKIQPDKETLIGEIKSAETEQLTSVNFAELKETLIEVYKDRIELATEIIQTSRDIQSAKFNYIGNSVQTDPTSPLQIDPTFTD